MVGEEVEAGKKGGHIRDETIEKKRERQLIVQDKGTLMSGLVW